MCGNFTTCFHFLGPISRVWWRLQGHSDERGEIHQCYPQINRLLRSNGPACPARCLQKYELLLKSTAAYRRRSKHAHHHSSLRSRTSTGALRNMLCGERGLGGSGGPRVARRPTSTFDHERERGGDLLRSSHQLSGTSRVPWTWVADRDCLLRSNSSTARSCSDVAKSVKK